MGGVMKGEDSLLYDEHDDDDENVNVVGEVNEDDETRAVRAHTKEYFNPD
jgi:hypothetical protein